MVLAWTTVAIVGAGCDGATDDDDACGTTLALDDGSNYSFIGTLDIQGYPVGEIVYPCEDPDTEICDITINWCGLTEDLQQHPMDPLDDVDMASLIVFQNLTQEEVEVGLSENSLQQVDMTVFVNNTDFQAGGSLDNECEFHLSDMSLFGNDIDIEQYFNASYGATWLFVLSKGTIPAVGTLMAAFLEPTAGETTAYVELTNDSTVLNFDVDLTTLTKVPGPTGDPALTADWANLTTSGLGIDFTTGDVDQLMIGHYASLTPEDLQTQFLDIEIIADDLYNMDLETVTTADMSQATSADGTGFPGFDDTGTWLVALRCTTCPNPAPPYLTIIDPCSE
jgi:hypothetical protein